jgi:LPXTG-motif cell wall-anchored protein
VDPVNTVAGGGDPGSPAPEVVLPSVVEQPAPAVDPAPAATLPRTGASSHLGNEVTLAFGLLGAGIALLMFRRRRPATEGQKG